MRKILLLSVLAVLGLCGQLFAQDRLVTGKVTDAKDGTPLPGVSIAVKGSTKGTTTDATGSYKVNAPANGTISVSFVGYSSQDVKIGSRSEVNVQMVESINQLSEVVVSGLATSVKRSNLANAVGTVSASQLTGTTTPITTDGALYGKLAGVTIQQNTSMPGGGFNVQLRGVSTLGASGSQPLFIVDGVYIDNSQAANGRGVANKATSGSNSDAQDNNPNRLADLNPDDIESMEVLKGASAAAIYGTRANAGVVIITTKRGKGGKTKVSFGQDIGFSEAQRFFGGAEWDEKKITDWFNADDIPAFKAAKASGKYYDYEKELYGEKGAIRNTHLSLTGGDDRTKFYVNGSFADEKGIIKNTGFSRASVRANIDHKITKWLDFGISSNYVFTNTDRGWAGNDNSNINYGYSIPYTHPWVELHPDANGRYPNNDDAVGENPLAIRDRATNNLKVNRFIQGFTANARILNTATTGLTFRLNGGFDYQSGYSLVYLPADLQSQKAEKNPGLAQDTRNEVTNTNFQASLIFTKSLMNNGLNLTTSAGLVRLTSTGRYDFTRGQGLPVGVNTPAAGSVITSVPFYSLNTDVGVFAQQEANYQDKIIATAGIRFDKSTLNGEFDRFYAFPRGSVAVNLAKFGNWAGDKVNQVKLRIAYGETGGVPTFGTPYTNLNVISTGGIGGLNVSTAGGNPKIQPERATELEYGVDFGLFGGRLNGEITLYNKKVFDLIQPLVTAPTTGLSSVQTNLADLANTGVELSLGGTPVKTKNFTWALNAIYYQNRSVITRLGIPTRNTGAFGATFGSYRIKLDRSPTEVVGNPKTDPADGTSFTVYGDHQPKFNLSLNNTFSYKNFDLTVLGEYRHQFTVISLARELFDEGGTTNDWNSTSLSKGANGKPATGADIVPNGIARQNANGIIDGVVQEGYNPSVASFFKLREVGLYYRIPSVVIKKAFRNVVEGIKFGFSGSNVFMWTDYKSGYDPENSNFGTQAINAGVDIGSTPPVRRLMFRVTIDL
jgi:TonB-linked SusC/RagA family outer membrane protein